MVAINHFVTDTDKEVKIIEEHLVLTGVKEKVYANIGPMELMEQKI